MFRWDRSEPENGKGTQMEVIDWIKDAVGICICREITQKAKNMQSAVLKEQYGQFSPEEKELVRRVIREQFDRKDCIYIYSVFLHDMPKEDFADAMLDAVLESEFSVYAGSMLELQIHKYYRDYKNLYPKVRAVHQNNVRSWNRQMMLNLPYQLPQDRNRNRIVLITEQLLDLVMHAPSRIVFHLAEAFHKMGFEITIFACPCDADVPDSLWHAPKRMNSIQPFEKLPLKYRFHGIAFEGYQINMHQQNLKEYHMMFTLIHALNPLFVLNLGVMNPAADVVSSFTTAAAFEMNIACPVSEAEILIRHERSEEGLEQIYAQSLEKNQTQLFMKQKFPVLVQEEKAEAGCTRKELGLPEHRFLAAVTGHRLNTDISPRFLDFMKELLQKLPELDFVIIGDADGIKTRLSEGDFNGRVFFLGPREHLMQVYRVTDLYLNPERAGGGFSSVMALMAGIPVLTLPDCDVARMAGEAFTVPDYDAMADTAAAYVSDTEFYQRQAEKAKETKEQNSPLKMEAYAKELLSGILQCIGVTL